MMVFQFLGPALASVLYVIVFQKAGFNGAMLAFCAAPILGSALWWVLMPLFGSGRMMLIPLITIPLTLLPLLILAFKSWPPVSAASNTGSEN